MRKKKGRATLRIVGTAALKKEVEVLRTAVAGVRASMKDQRDAIRKLQTENDKLQDTLRVQDAWCDLFAMIYPTKVRQIRRLLEETKIKADKDKLRAYWETKDYNGLLAVVDDGVAVPPVEAAVAVHHIAKKAR